VQLRVQLGSSQRWLDIGLLIDYLSQKHTVDIKIFYLPRGTDQSRVIRCIAEVLHSEEFAAYPPRRHNQDNHEINFKVKLNEDPRGGVGHDGSGLLTLPTSGLGNKFLEWVKRNPLEIDKGEVKFLRPNPAPQWLAMTLQKTQYVDPVDEVRQKKLEDLDDPFLVDAIQFGLFYRPKYPSPHWSPWPCRPFLWNTETTQGDGCPSNTTIN